MAKNKVKKPFYKKIWVWVVAIIVVIAIANSGSSDDTTVEGGENTTTSGEQTSSENTETSEEPAETTYTIGDTVSVGDVTYTINEVSTAETVGPEFMTEEASGIYVIVNATVKNEGNEAMTLDSSYLKLKQGEKTFEADTGATMSANEDAAAFFLEQVNPGSELTGNVAFDVSPEIAEGELQLEVAEGMFGTVTETINLQ